jgi:WD40 repeat protein
LRLLKRGDEARALIALLAAGSHDDRVRLWDPRTGEQRADLDAHPGGVNAVCAVTVDGRDLLASGGADGTVRLWDLRSGTCVVTAPAHHPVLGLASVAGSLAIGFDTGMLVIKPTAVA